MSRKPRDYQGEYARRIARGQAAGHTRSQARGHPKPAESPVWTQHPPKPIEDARLQRGLRALRQQGSLKAAARASGISPERLRHYAGGKKAIEKQRGRWVLAPSAHRQVMIFTRGRSVRITVADSAAASLAGSYMAAVGKFLETNEAAVLAEFQGRSILDTQGRNHPLETNPNALYRADAEGGETFEHVYRIVI